MACRINPYRRDTTFNKNYLTFQGSDLKICENWAEKAHKVQNHQNGWPFTGGGNMRIFFANYANIFFCQLCAQIHEIMQLILNISVNSAPISYKLCATINRIFKILCTIVPFMARLSLP